MVFRQYELVIFDFDGTIADLDVDWAALKKELSEHYGVDIGQISGRLDAFIDSLPDDDRRAAHKIVERHEMENISNAKPIAKTIKIIAGLGGRRLAVFTTNTKAAIEKALNLLGIYDRFEMIVCKEDVRKHKPDPEGLLRILKATGVPAERAVYIGDRQKDADAGEAAGIRTVLVSDLEKEADG